MRSASVAFAPCLYEANLVGQPGLECGPKERAASTGDAPGDRSNARKNSAEVPSGAATEIAAESPRRSTVLDAKSTVEPQRSGSDDALRAAIKAAVDAGDLARVRALVAVLEAPPAIDERDAKPENVVRLASRRRT